MFIPTAFKLGLVITVLMTYLTFDFYYALDDSTFTAKEDVGFLQQIHKKTIDWRMVARGRRRGSDRVVILGVDEPAIENLGRWPWSRDTMAKLIDTIVGYGASVVAFDMIFSEKEKNRALSILTELERNPAFVAQKDYLVQKLDQANTDQRFAEVIEKRNEHLVMGMYFDGEGYKFPSHTNEQCANIIYEQTAAYEYLEDDEKPLIAQASIFEELPDPLYEYIEEKIQSLAEQITAESPGMSKADLDIKIRDEQLLYCARLLMPEANPDYPELLALWPSIQEKLDGEYANLSAEDYFAGLSYYPFKYQIGRSGRLWTNIESFREATSFSGYFNAFLDKDGTIRKSNLIYRYGDTFMPSLALKTVMVDQNYSLFVDFENNPRLPEFVKVKEMTFKNPETGETYYSIPVNSQGALQINYAGPQKMFAHISAWEVLKPGDEALIEMDYENLIQPFTVKKSEWIKDKIFVIGATAVGVYDLRVTPFEENFPGVETHANVIDNLLRQDFLTSNPLEQTYMAGSVLLMGLLLSFALSRMGAISGMLLTMTTIASIYFTDKEFFFGEGIVIAIILPLLMVSTLYISLTFFKYFTEERKKKELKGTFQKYVSPAIVDEVLSDAKNLELGGRKERMTVLFSDIRGFTTISEQLDPKELGDFLNSYLTPMTDLVFANKGTLDKYMGDAVMAFFGAPINYPDHAKMACKCCLDMMDKLAELQEEYKKQGLPPIDIGIGLNTGDMSVGNMGSETVRSYTVMGDAVNLGARLEGINKQYGTHIMISEFTYEDVKDDFVCREVDRVRVKGKLEPVKIYELVAQKANFNDPTKEQVIEHFNKAYKLYMGKDFESSKAELEKALQLDPEDGPSILFMERVQDFIASPPPENWDGVFVMTTK